MIRNAGRPEMEMEEPGAHRDQVTVAGAMQLLLKFLNSRSCSDEPSPVSLFWQTSTLIFLRS